MKTKTTIAELMERASWYEALALMFQHPTDESITRIRSLISCLASPGDGIGLTNEIVSRFRDDLSNTDLSSFRKEHNRLFTTAGACRANETDYERLSFSMTQQLADVSGFYQAFGLEVDSSSGERPDFVGTELEFMRLLLLKQAYAEENELREQAEITEKAVRDFIQSHLANWIPAFCSTLLRAAGEGPYATGATLLEAFVSSESTSSSEKAPE